MGELISIKDASDVDKTTDTTFIGYINPLRYRGYYYDTETGLYYLNARYYDPEVGRFINADETLDGGYNLFEYCFNNPIDLVDYMGEAEHRFISKFDADKIVRMLVESTPKQTDDFRSILFKVYRDNNLGIVEEDILTLSNILKQIEKVRDKWGKIQLIPINWLCENIRSFFK